MRKVFSGIAAAAVIVGAAGLADAQEEKFITIGTGGQTGVYFVVGQSICGLVNRGQREHGIRCTAPSTGGSIANINAMRAGDMDMGVAQSDWQFHAYNGTSQFEEQGPFEDLRAVFSVHGEPFNVIARADSGIETFTDLSGQAGQYRQSRLGPAGDHGGRHGGHGLDDGRLRARVRAAAGRAGGRLGRQ